MLSNLLRSLLSPPSAKVTAARGAKVKAGKKMRNNRKTTSGKHRTIKVEDGQWVEQNTILATQNTFNFYPGQNVRVGRYKTLNSCSPGYVKFCVEQFTPRHDSNIYSVMKARNPDNDKIIGRFIHVIPPPNINRFRLISFS